MGKCINTDAAINKIGKKIGFGLVIRDAISFVMPSISQNVIATFSPHVVEAEAILHELQFARDLGLLLMTVELDTAELDTAVVIKWINEGSHCGADVCLVLDEINTLIRFLGCVAVNFVQRKAN
ncbi:hypothetical protein Q3G72_008729 [Acer saccharum]|nr:hypothetical protein Q3G72_008729 [Acer saccharum]